jgi:hypothetical protein
VASRSASGTEKPKPKERTKLLAVLTVVMATGTVTLLALHHSLRVGWPVIAATLAVWVGVSIVLRKRPKTWGKERPVIDWWSVPHFGAGVLLAMFGIGGALVIVIAVLWECVELTCRVHEFPTNRVADLALALSGWIIVNLATGAPLTAW